MTDIDCLGGEGFPWFSIQIYLSVCAGVGGGGEKGMELVDESATANFYF